MIGDNVEWMKPGVIVEVDTDGKTLEEFCAPDQKEPPSHWVKVRLLVAPPPESDLFFGEDQSQYMSQRLYLYGKTDEQAEREFVCLRMELCDCAALYVRHMGLHRVGGRCVTMWEPESIKAVRSACPQVGKSL